MMFPFDHAQQTNQETKVHMQTPKLSITISGSMKHLTDVLALITDPGQMEVTVHECHLTGGGVTAGNGTVKVHEVTNTLKKRRPYSKRGVAPRESNTYRRWKGDPKVVWKVSDNNQYQMDVAATCSNLGITVTQLLSEPAPRKSLRAALSMAWGKQGRRINAKNRTTKRDYMRAIRLAEKEGGA